MTTKPQKNVLEILWIRHGHSCGNSKDFSDMGKWNKLRYLQVLNPSLSDLGLLQVKEARQAYHGNNKKSTLGKFLKRTVDKVFCSDMLRAHETAYELFPSKKIHVLPFVNEKGWAEWMIRWGWDLENRNEDPQKTNKKLKALGRDTDRFDRKLYHKVARGRLLFPNLDRFMREVVHDHWLNPNSSHYLFKKKGQHKIRVAIVSHGHFLRDLVQQATRAGHSFWSEAPYFRAKHCRHIQYDRTQQAFGNLAMFMTPLTNRDVDDWLQKKERFGVSQKIYETEAVYDPNTNTCMEYGPERRIISSYGRAHHVRRCPAKIRNIFNDDESPPTPS